jgi:hypothetical protein
MKYTKRLLPAVVTFVQFMESHDLELCVTQGADRKSWKASIGDTAEMKNNVLVWSHETGVTEVEAVYNLWSSMRGKTYVKFTYEPARQTEILVPSDLEWSDDWNS